MQAPVTSTDDGVPRRRRAPLKFLLTLFGVLLTALAVLPLCIAYWPFPAGRTFVASMLDGLADVVREAGLVELRPIDGPREVLTDFQRETLRLARSSMWVGVGGVLVAVCGAAAGVLALLLG